MAKIIGAKKSIWQQVCEGKMIMFMLLWICENVTIIFLLNVFLESMKLSSPDLPVLCGQIAAQWAPSSPSTAPVHTPLSSMDSPQPRSAYLSALLSLSDYYPLNWSSLVSLGVCGRWSSEGLWPSSLPPCSGWLLCVRKTSSFKPEAPINSWYIASTTTWT